MGRQEEYDLFLFIYVSVYLFISGSAGSLSLFTGFL